MEYVAFLFLGLGVLLVLAGVLLQVRDKRTVAFSPLDAYRREIQEENATSVASAILRKSAPTPAVAVAPASVAATEHVAPSPVAAPVGHSVPGPFQFVQNEPVAVAAPVQPAVAVSVQNNNPRLFEKFAYLYLDSSQRNIYDGAGSAAAFDLTEVSGIRRFGRGVFAYDGFSFYFDHTSGQERFPLANLKTVGFYPNCVALTFRGQQPVALLFMEETESIRKVLETFRTPT